MSNITSNDPSKAHTAGTSLWAKLGTTAGIKVVVMGLTGLFAVITSKLIISHFGTDAYAQYGLLSSFPTLLPFADLGIAAVVINAIAESKSPRKDEQVRRSILTALRILLISGSLIIAISAFISIFGWWPLLLGNGLEANGGSLAAFACLAIFALALPLSVGQRILVGLERTGTQVMSQVVVAPLILAAVAIAIAVAAPAGSYLAVFSYLASAVNSVICLVIAGRLIHPQLASAIRSIVRFRRDPGVRVVHLAWPMLLQMIALPIAMQSDRLLLSHLTRGPELAQYNLASQLFGMILQTIAAAGIALWPFYAKARSVSRIESPLVPTMWFATGGLVLSGMMAAVSPWLVRFISDGKIILDPWILLGFVIFVLLQAAKYPVGMYMTDRSGLRFQVIPILVLVPINLALSWWLIGLVGAAGPILGSAISVALCQVLPNLWYVHRDLRRRRNLESQVESGPAAVDLQGP
ncbi:lipopolysaccharide biosynthesis protein [Arthrobacter sp. H14-L1]|uniref:lipopolysaccharide biosynthesis protein n=1 Tax=Arthrobacter sp. H14-L1 TaxID=2996697 RepID=UPI002270B82C|nr:oligosaccharide flippase family protein [Arthrobacter sp. H14-L1]MCY0905737.1 oligosaccharide flippase family protein [Arthrobacter sp. H14-L1]